MIHYYNKFKEEKKSNISLEEFNDVIDFIDSRGKLAFTFKFYHMIYDFYNKLDKKGKLQKQLIQDVKDEFRVSSVTIFGVLKYFKE